jgi:hypothetical protein
MATRSSIAVKAKDEDMVKIIYCHFDGYPSHHLPILTEHYNSQELAEKLANLGDLSVLDTSADCPEGHTFETPIKGYCIAYGRDRGETETEPRLYWNIKLAQNHSEEQEYNYYWNGECWTVTKD